MTNRPIKILGISGSLRQGSSASALLTAIGRLFPAHAAFTVYEGLAAIPPFNDSNEVPAPVAAFIQLLTEADGIFFCTPEYAFGVSGVLKNALDWTVSSMAFYDKPVALVTAASSGEKAHAALLLTLTALSTKISQDTSLLISFVRTKLNEANEVTDVDTLNAIKRVIDALLRTIEESNP